MAPNSFIFNFNDMKIQSNLTRVLKIIFLCGLVASGFEIRLRNFSSSPFISKGKKIVLPANKEYVFINDTMKRMDPIIRVKKNSLGFRGAEPPVDFGNYFSIVVLGGSTAACDNLTEGKTWVDLIQRKLKEAFPTIWINNAGFAGHSTVAHILLLEDYIVNLHPKMVIFFVGINDVDVEQNEHFTEGIVRNKFQFNSILDFLRSVNRNIQVINVMVNMGQQYFGHKRVLSYGEADLKAMPRLTLSAEQKSAAMEVQREKNVKAFGDRLQRLYKTSRVHGIIPVFVTVPSLYGDQIDDVTGLDLGDIKVAEGRNAGLMGTIVELYINEIKVLAHQGIYVIDLAGKMPKSSRYFGDFYHFTNEGAAKAADIIYPELSKILSSQNLKNN